MMLLIQKLENVTWTNSCIEVLYGYHIYLVRSLIYYDNYKMAPLDKTFNSVSRHFLKIKISGLTNGARYSKIYIRTWAPNYLKS